MPAVTRPGGRTAAVRDAVLRAAADLLVESGLEGIELTAVAQRAGVGKSTVYRRWGTVPALVADLLADMADTSSQRPSTGSLSTDLLAAAKLIRRTLTDVAPGPALQGDHRHRHVRPDHRTRAGGLLPQAHRRGLTRRHRAVDRGEAPTGIDAREVIRQLSAPLYYRFLTDTLPIDDRRR